MKFSNILKTITTPPKQERPLSRLFGYQRGPDGNITVVDSEASVIEAVITAFATRPLESVAVILDDLLRRFVDEGIRNRSAQRWTKNTLLNLIRPIYCGAVVSKFGSWRRSKLYPKIVDQKYLKLALRRMNRQNAVQKPIR